MNWFHRQPIRVRITLAFLVAMAVLLLASGAFIYERMQFALDRSIRDVPKAQRAEILARRQHRDEALAELLGQLAVAYGATLAVAGLVGYRMTRAALDPVEAMQRQAGAPAAASSHVRLDVPETNDELSRLARTLNALLANAQDAIDRERRFVANASHELRTPLSLLKLQVDVALSRERSHEELREALERVRDETDALVRLANDLLVIAQADEGTLELAPAAIPASALLGAAAVRFEHRAAAAGRNIVVAPVDAEMVLFADPDRLQQALTNLIDNALRHGRGDVRLRSGHRDGFAEIHVEDQGPGFPAGFARRAFDRFATASSGRNTEGAGLGLAIVKAIAEAHGGKAHAVNGAHGGADISISLPLAANGAVGMRPSAGQAIHE